MSKNALLVTVMVRLTCYANCKALFKFITPCCKQSNVHAGCLATRHGQMPAKCFCCGSEKGKKVGSSMLSAFFYFKGCSFSVTWM